MRSIMALGAVLWLGLLQLQPEQALAQTLAQSTTAETERNLRETIKEIFGVDLNIGGGTGSKPSDPIVILDESPNDARLTQHQLLNTLSALRDGLWRTTGRRFLAGAERVEEVRVEFLDPYGSEPPEEDTMFFQMPAATDSSLPAIIRLPDFKPGLPVEIGWVHFRSYEDFEQRGRGLGYGLTYAATGIKATFYVYDWKLNPKEIRIGSKEFRDQFKRAKRDVTKVQASAREVGAPELGEVLYLQTYSVDDGTSILGLGVYGGKFFKIRITYDGSEPLRKPVSETLAAVKALIAPPP